MAENHDKVGAKLQGLEALNNETVDLVSEPEPFPDMQYPSIRMLRSCMNLVVVIIYMQ